MKREVYAANLRSKKKNDLIIQKRIWKNIYNLSKAKYLCKIDQKNNEVKFLGIQHL